MGTPTRKRIGKPAKKVVAKKMLAKKTPAKKILAKKTPAKASKPAVFRVDLSAFPPESVTWTERSLCVACVWQIFTRAMNLAPKTALSEMKRYSPSFEELTSAEAARPFFAAQDKQPCPYCGSPAKWHARIETHRIESGKATDVLRRNLVKSLPKADDQFVVLEQKATQQQAFFEWLEKISDQSGPGRSQVAARRLAALLEPQRAQGELASGICGSSRHPPLAAPGARAGSGGKAWEVDGDRLYLAPMLFDELLLVQYLVSRSQLAGGLTLERRYTLPELWRRFRHSGYLRSIGVQADNPSDALEQMLEHLSGGEASVRYYYIVDRRELLEKVKTLATEKPRARAAGR